MSQGCCWTLLETSSPRMQGISWRVVARPAGKHGFDPRPGVWTSFQTTVRGAGSPALSSLQSWRGRDARQWGQLGGEPGPGRRNASKVGKVSKVRAEHPEEVFWTPHLRWGLLRAGTGSEVKSQGPGLGVEHSADLGAPLDPPPASQQQQQVLTGWPTLPAVTQPAPVCAHSLAHSTNSAHPFGARPTSSGFSKCWVWKRGWPGAMEPWAKETQRDQCPGSWAVALSCTCVCPLIGPRWQKAGAEDTPPGAWSCGLGLGEKLQTPQDDSSCVHTASGGDFSPSCPVYSQPARAGEWRERGQGGHWGAGHNHGYGEG